MNIHVLNRQKLCEPDIGKLKMLTAFFLDQIKADKINISEVTLLLMDDAGILPLNRRFFDRAGGTDVISFLLAPHPTKTGKRTAEIVVNVERAIQEGRKRSGFKHEFSLYLAHGCDHLAGHDDRNAVERSSMRRRELSWLKKAVTARLLSGLFAFARIPRGVPRHHAKAR